MNYYLVLALLIGTLAMLGVMLLARKWIVVKCSKVILFSVLLTICGFASVKLMYFIENGEWDGLSFFGAILFEPLFILLLSLILREKWTTLLDLSAPSISVMQAVMKLECLRSGCCRGRLLYLNPETGKQFVFPSREVELIAALLIATLLVYLISRKKTQGEIYPIYMVIYGIVRFALNWFRNSREAFVWLLPAGNFWALVAILIGAIWLLILRQEKSRSQGNSAL